MISTSINNVKAVCVAIEFAVGLATQLIASLVYYSDRGPTNLVAKVMMGHREIW